MLICMIITVAFYSGTFCQQIDPVCTAAKGNFPQCGKVFQGEKMVHGLFRLSRLVHLPGTHTLQQFLGLDIHQFHLARLIKNRIRYTFTHQDSRYGCNRIVQTFNMLHIYCGINIYSGI